MATVPVPYSPIAGDDATQARVLTWADSCAFLLGSATSGGSKRPLCVMRQTVTQSLTSGTAAAITLDTEDVDYDNGHSTATNTSRYTAATAGWYDVKYLVCFAGNATGSRQAWLKLNGTTDINATAVITPGHADGTSSAGARSLFLNAGDFIELIALQDAGVALGTNITTKYMSMLSVEWRSN